MNIPGTFDPPLIGHRTVPIPLIGSGYLHLTPAGLGIQGFRLPRRVRLQLSRLVTLAVLFWLIAIGSFFIALQGSVQQILVWLGIPPADVSAIVQWLGYPVFVVGFSVWLTWLIARVKGIYRRAIAGREQVRVLIPWDHVGDIRLDAADPTCVLIDVDDAAFRHQLPLFRHQGGTVHFRPDPATADAQTVMVQLGDWKRA